MMPNKVTSKKKKKSHQYILNMNDLYQTVQPQLVTDVQPQYVFGECKGVQTQTM